MSSDAAMLLMIAGMHLLGLVCAVGLLIPALRHSDPPPPPDSGSDGGWGRRTDAPPKPCRPRGGLPLPDAVPARVRLRDHRRLSELVARPARRQVREPERAPARVR